jgi:hypothetical protein
MVLHPTRKDGRKARDNGAVASAEVNGVRDAQAESA